MTKNCIVKILETRRWWGRDWNSRPQYISNFRMRFSSRFGEILEDEEIEMSEATNSESFRPQTRGFG